MKQPSDMPTLRFEHGGSDLWANTLPLDQGGALLAVKQTNTGYLPRETNPTN